MPYPIEGASNRYRIHQYLPYLEKEGITFQVRPFVSPKFYNILYKKKHFFSKFVYFFLCTLNRLFDLVRALKVDIVFIHRECFPFGPPVLEFILCKILFKPIIYDFDDAIYVCTEGKLFEWFKNPGKVKRIISWSDYVIAGNEYLRNYAIKFNKNIRIIPTPIETFKFKPFDNKEEKRKEKIKIGWIGSHSTAKYLLRLSAVFQRLVEKYNFDLIIVGAEQRINIPGVNVINKAWSLDREVEDFQDLTIGIYPLPENKWTLGKCGFKAIQYMAVGIPVVASPVGVNKEIIYDGHNGFFASTDQEWIDKLSLLIENYQLRRKIGDAGRKTVEKNYSVIRNSRKLLEILKSLSRTNIMQLIGDLDIGGTEKMLAELVNGLDKSKYNLTVCSIKPIGIIAEEIKKIRRVRLISLNVKSKFNFLVFFRLFYLLKKYHIHLLQSYLFFDNFIGRIAGKLANTPIIISGLRDLICLDPPWKNKLDSWSSIMSDLIISNSYAAKKELIELENIPESKIAVIHNGKNPDYFKKKVNLKRIKAELNIDDKEYIVGILARLHKKKNHFLFLNTAKEVLKWVPNVIFVVVGDGDAKLDLINFAKKLGIENKVIFTGSRKDIVNILSIFDISILTSKVEGLPGTIIESMALSKPIVSTPVGGVTEVVVADKTGFLGNTQKELACAIVKLLQNKKLRKKMGCAGKKRFIEYFSVDRMIKKYEQIYDNMIQLKLEKRQYNEKTID